jgi:glycerophosphoryl diester phosphodiesterase
MTDRCLGVNSRPDRSAFPYRRVPMSENPWLSRRILRYAHQGGAREAPSSTMFAFDTALSNGANAFEMDVHCTTDRVLVVCHDIDVDRTTDGTGPIASITWAEIAELDNAFWWAPGHQAIRGLSPDSYPHRGRAPQDRRLGVARLDEVLQAYPDVVINLDIKQTEPDVEPFEDLLADMLRKYERSDDVIVASFHDRALSRFRALAPEFATSFALHEALDAVGALESGATIDHLTSHVALQIPLRWDGIDRLLISKRLIEAAHANGVAVHAWTIDDRADMELLVDMGVDGIISDCPSVLSSVVPN